MSDSSVQTEQLFSEKSAPSFGAVSASENWLSALGLGSFVSVDTETTGLAEDNDQIIEIGLVRFESARVADEFQTFLSIDRSIPPFITRLTGISDRDLIGAPRFADIAPRIRDFIGSDVVVGQNPEFDFGFLRAELMQSVHRQSISEFAFLNGLRLDSAQIGRIFWPELPSFSLAALCRHFEISLAAAHRAIDDARATGQLMCRMAELLPDRVWPELAVALHKLIGGTTHRSRFFFAALQSLAAGGGPPRAEEQTGKDAHGDEFVVSEDLDELLGEKGLFSVAFPHFEFRAPQFEMAATIEQAIEERHFLVIEAPTGVGKSLAYLLPALRWSDESEGTRRQVIVSSYTKTLQDQLQKKDAREISQALGRTIRTSVLKGRNNYLCRRRFDLLLREPADRLSELDRLALMPLVRWALSTSSGDVSEIGGFQPRRNPYLWSLVSSDASACSGNACGAGKGDFFRAASDRSQKSRLVFVNHSLLLTDPERFASSTSCERILVLDEAHHVERAAVSALTVELSPVAIRNVLVRFVDERSPRGFLARVQSHATGDFASILVTLKECITGTYELSRQVFAAIADECVDSSGDLRRAYKIRLRDGSKWHSLVANHMMPLALRWKELTRLAGIAEVKLRELRSSDDIPAEVFTEWRSTVDRVVQVESTIALMCGDETSNFVRWVEAGKGRSGSWCTLFAAPIEVSSTLADQVWKLFPTVVFTSATLSTSGSFDYFKSTVGLHSIDKAMLRETRLASPFNLAMQMKCLVPTFMPDPRQNDKEYQTAVSGLATHLVDSLPLGTLILCTSLEQVENIARILSPVARKSGRALFTHTGGALTGDLIDNFRSSKVGILVGASTLWEGIDIMGDALQLLIVLRLPFDVPTEPWIEAKCEALQAAGKDAFSEFSVPATTLRLKQGLGRLIRHANDRGVAVIVDSRLVKTNYGKRIAQSFIPAPMPVSSEDELIELARNFILERRAS